MLSREQILYLVLAGSALISLMYVLKTIQRMEDVENFSLIDDASDHFAKYENVAVPLIDAPLVVAPKIEGYADLNNSNSLTGAFPGKGDVPLPEILQNQNL